MDARTGRRGCLDDHGRQERPKADTVMARAIRSRLNLTTFTRQRQAHLRQDVLNKGRAGAVKMSICDSSSKHDPDAFTMTQESHDRQHEKESLHSFLAKSRWKNQTVTQ